MSTPTGTPLSVFTDEHLVEALYELSHALRSWEWLAATESCEESSPEEIAASVLDRLIGAAVAARYQIGPAVLERLAAASASEKEGRV